MTKVWAGLLGAWCVGGVWPLLMAQAPVGSGPIVGQGRVTAPISAAATSTLQSMAAQASVIFAGHVVAVSFANGYVETRFRVDQAVRGCPKSGTYLLREWSGLWTGESPRYSVGDRRLMMLYARNAAGMSSPVNGMDGAIPIVGSAMQPVANERGIAPAEDGTDATDVASMTIDLRWVQAAETRSTTPLAGASNAGAEAGPWAGPVAVLEGFRAVSATSAGPTVATVLALFGAAPADPVKAFVAR